MAKVIERAAVALPQLHQGGEGETSMSSLATMLQAPGAMVQCDDDPEAVYEFLCAKGWSDGLPVIPPTPERVERMLAFLRSRFRCAGRENPAALRRRDADTRGRQCGDGGLQAGVFSARTAGARSDGRRAIQPVWHAGDHPSVHADADIQRPDRQGSGHQFRQQRHGQLFSRQRGDRARRATGAGEHRCRDSRHRRHGNGRHAGEIYVLRGGERRRESVGPVAR